MVTRRDSQLLVFQDFFFLFIYLFDGQFCLFSFSDSNTYLDAEISIISFTFWWTRNNFGVIFSFVYTLSFRFVYISRSCRLLWPESLYSKFYFSQAFKFSELKFQI